MVLILKARWFIPSKAEICFEILPNVGPASPWMLCTILGPTIKKGCWGMRTHAEESNEADKRAERNDQVGWRHWLCWIWRKGEWGVTSILSTSYRRGEVERRVLSTFPGRQWQDTWEGFKAKSGEVQTWHYEMFLHWGCGQTVELAS